jgi:hypothetical protein
MSPRPTDWSPVGYDSDPIPGEPEAVAAAGTSYRKTVEAINVAITNLDRLDAGSQKGLAIAAVLDQIKSVRKNLSDSESRVTGAAEALEGYQPVLSKAQSDSAAALQEAEHCAEDKRRATERVNESADRHNKSTDPAEKEKAKADWERANRERETAEGGVNQARSKIAAAITARDDAANKAIALLQQIEGSSPVKDGFWDKVVEWCGNAADWIDKNLKPFLEGLAQVLDVLSVVCTIAAAILAATGVGAPVAAFLLAASRVMAGVSFGISVFLDGVVGLMKAISGRQSWAAFGGAVMGLVGTYAIKKVKGFLKGKTVDGVMKAGKAALSSGNAMVKSAASWVVNHKPQVEKAAKFVTGKVVDGAVAAGKWLFSNAIVPKCPPMVVPHTQYRRAYGAIA